MRTLASLRSRLFVAFAAFTLALIAGCGGGGGSSSSVSIAISATSGSIAAGMTNQLRAIETDSGGIAVDVTDSVTWSSSSPSVATVNATGLLTGVAPGSTTISAKLKSTAASLSVTIGTAIVEKISISPQSASVFTGGEQQFRATATYSDGSTKDLTGSASWSVSPLSVATISADGLLTGVGAGSFTVTAVSGSVAGSATGTVSTPVLSSISIAPAGATIVAGATQQFTATGKYNDQSTKDVTASVVWSSSNTSVLTINAAGLATAGSVNASSAVTVDATLGSVSATAKATVAPSAIMSSLQVRPTSSSIASGTAEAHTAIAFYTDGTQKDVTNSVTWSVAAANLSPAATPKSTRATASNAIPAASDTTAITVNQSGIDFANNVGAANVQASIGSMQAQSIVLVTAATVKAIAISSPSLLFPVSAKQQFTLSGYFSNGSSQDLSLTANWKSSNPSVATISSSGVVTALKAGSFTISASFGGLTTAKAAEVVSADLVSTNIRVDHPALVVNINESLRVIGTFSNGNTQDLTPLSTWNSSDPTVALIDNTGFLQPIGPGRTQITSTVGGVSSQTTIDVASATLSSLQIRPANASFALGTSLQFTLIGTFADGVQGDITNAALWVSSNPSVLTINSQGVAKSGSVGTATLTATFLGVSQTSSLITVTDAALNAITLSPASAQIAKTTHQQYAATGWFSDGSIEDLGNDVLWTTSDATVASVDNGGIVLGLKAGTSTVNATLSGITATAPVTVTNALLTSTAIIPGDTELPIGVSRQFALMGTFSDGTTQNMSADAVWQSPTPSIVFTDPSGAGTADSVGIGTLSALVGNFSSSTQVNVTDASLTGISLTPADTVIRVRGSQQMTATGTFSDGFSQNLYLNAVFNAANNKIVNIGNPGLAVGTGIGSTTITASFRGITASTTSFKVESGTLSSIALTPSNPGVNSGGTQQLTATGTYADGTTSDLSSQVTWTSSSPAVLSIDANGLATANTVTSQTTVTVTATLGSTTASFTVTIYPFSSPTLVSITITPTSASLLPGATQQFTATGTYSDTSTKDLTTSVTWSSSNTSALSIDASGLATANSVNSSTAVTVGAQLGSITASAAVNVAPHATMQSIQVRPTSSSIAAGTAEAHVALAFYSDGTQEDVTNQVTWSVTPSSLLMPSGRKTRASSKASSKSSSKVGGLAGVGAGVGADVRSNDSSSGVITVNQSGVDYASQAGAANVQASLGTLQAASVVLVTDATVQRIAISTTEVVFPVGTLQQFTLNGFFSDGTNQDLSLTANWQSSDTSIATISGTGMVTALKAGKVKFSASFGGLTATRTADVTSATLVDTAMRIEYSLVVTKVTQQLSVIGKFSDGSNQDLTPLATWESSDPTVASVDSTGLVQSIRNGQVQIKSTVDGISSLVSILVLESTVASIQIVPDTPSFALGTSLQLSAKGTFVLGANEGIDDISDQVQWVSSDPTVLTIDANGLAKSFGTGTTTVTASFHGTTQISTPITVTDATLTALQLTPTSAKIAAGTHQQYAATGWFSDGSIQSMNNDAIWSTSNQSVAAADNNGNVLGVAPGSAMVYATFSGTTTSSPLTVTGATLVSTVITPGNSELPAGILRPFALIGSFSDGTTQDLSADAIWQAPTPLIVTVTPTGVGSGVLPGVGTVNALLGNFSSSTQVTCTDVSLNTIVMTLTPAAPVIRVGGSQQMTVTGTFSDGYSQNLYLNAVFDAANKKVVNIGQPGLAVGTAIGSTQVTASFRGQTVSTTSFTVESGTLTSITLGPSNATALAGSPEQLTATGIYADGTTSDLSGQVTWTSSNPAVLSIDSNGLATAQPVTTTTTVTVTATLGSTTNSFSVTVYPPGGSVVTALTVTPSSASILPGATQQFTAVATFVDGGTKDVSTSASWSSSNPTAATIDSNGLATGAATGGATITAQFGGLSASAALTVSPATLPGATLTSVALTPASASISAGATQQFIARGAYSDGSLQDVTSRATWHSSNSAAGTVNTSGLATGLAGGATVIGATLSGVTGTATLTVSSVSGATLTSIVVTSTSSRLVAGLSEQLTATGSYSDGTTRDLSSSVSWSSSDTSIASVNNTGLVNGVGAGTALISASIDSQQSQSTIIVTAASLTSAAISPSGVSLPQGGEQQLTLTGTFSDGSRQDLTSLATWTSLAPGVASVSSTGLAAAVSQGTAQVTASYGGQTVTTTVQVTSATLVSVAISPQNATFAEGTTEQFTVTGTYSDGTTRDLTSFATFSSSNPPVATISSNGLAKGIAPGTAQISVSVDGESASTQTVIVSSAKLVSIAITPSAPSFAEGTTEQFTAIGTFSDGSTQDLSSQVVWTSSDPQTATIDTNGLATGGTPGTTRISATFGGVSSTTGSVQVTVATLTGLSITPTTAQLAKGTTQQFTATGTYSDGTAQDLTSTVTWASSNGAVASVNASGLATANGVGSAQITASFDGQSASTTSFSVSPATLVSIAFTPANPTVAVGTSTQMIVTGTFSDGSTQNLSSSADYVSSDPSVVTVSDSGVISGVAPGTSTVTVTVDGVTSTFTAVVSNATLVSITISPASPPSIPKGTTLQFTANGTYSDGSTQDLSSTVTWTSSNAAILTINAHGLATGTGIGTATLTATYQGQTATTPGVQVTAAVPASITVTPAGTSLTVGGSQQYTAIVTYTDATTQNVSSSATWSSSNTAVASISSTGEALALSPGSTTIMAVYDAISGSTGLTVVPVVAPTLNSVMVTPSSASIANGNTQQFTATGVYSDGSMQNLTSSASWQSSMPTVASVNSSGLATGLAGGSTQISAAYGGMSGVATLTVSPATLVSLAVTPTTATLAKGTSQQYKAIGTLSNGSTEDLTNSVTWSSSNGSVATINTSGLATGAGAGTATITAQAGSVSGTASMTVTSATVVSLQVTPAVVNLPAGGVQQLLVTAIFTDGSSQNVTTSAIYSSSTPSVVTADVNGKLTAAGTGSATVTVSLGSAATTVPVVVTSATLTSLSVTPSTLSLAVGGSQQMKATGTFSDGSTQNLTDSVVWTSSAPQVAAVSTTGNVTVAETGSATITATDGTVTGTASLTATSATVTAIAVSPAPVTLAIGQTQQFAATATMSDGSQQTVTTSATWSTSDATKGTISNIPGTNGLLAATSAGTFTVTATLNSVAGSASVTVTNAVLLSLTVSPSPVSLAAGTTRAMTVTGNYSDGSTANVTSSASWATTSAAVATVDSSGVLHGVSAGSATVTATVGLVSQTDAVTVSSAVLSSIAVSLASSNVAVGLNTQATATGTYSDGSTQNLTSQVQWSSSVPSVATVSTTGVVSTLSSGSTELIATLGSVTNQTLLTVTSAALQSIAVQASQSSVALGLSLQLTAIGTYSDNSTVNLTSQVTWSSQTPTVGVVSSTGVASGLTTGNFNAQATLAGKTGSLPITVTSAVLQSITITPANTVIVYLLGGTGVQFTATGQYSDGTTQNITDSCHWAVTSGLSTGTISQTGSFTAVGVGLGTLSATSGSISGSTGFTVVSL